jgi:hypothetical protein
MFLGGCGQRGLDDGWGNLNIGSYYFFVVIIIIGNGVSSGDWVDVIRW